MGTARVTAIDGRRARAARTREAIVEATIALVDEGDFKPRAATIAARAGLSVRSVFQHFADLEDLFVAICDQQTRRIAHLYAPVDYAGDVQQRIDAFVGQRARLYEAIAPIRRAANLHAPLSPVVAERLQLARSLARIDVDRAFGPEMDAIREAGDPHRGDALAAATSFVVWDEMRRGGLDVAATTATLRSIVAALVGAAPR